MAEPSPAERLRQIAEEMRSALPSLRKWYGGGTDFGLKAVATMGKLLSKAVAAGGFAGPEYIAFRLFIEDKKESQLEDWCVSLGVQTALHHLPDVGVDVKKGDIPWEVAFDGMAKLIDAEADKLKGGSGGKGRRKKKTGPKGPQYDAEDDRKISDGWETWKANGGDLSIEKYAQKKHGATTRKELVAIERAIERERKRQRRKGLK